jgi:primosomal protein N' (replication factor Y) (superfamily II helicase)
LIVLDEEHEASFKQDNVPRYHARDVALHRSFLEQIPLVLGSATPSLESWKRAQNGVYRLASLPRRIHNRPLPHVATIDLRSEKPEPGQGAISRPLHQAMEETLAAKGQVMLLLNRRGFATTIQCPQCGHVVACPDCDLPLTHHRDGGKACCHYCDFHDSHPASLSGVQIRRDSLFRARARSVGGRSSAALSSAPAWLAWIATRCASPGAMNGCLSEFRRRQDSDLARYANDRQGARFPNVLLVGVINADTSLHFPDFRARKNLSDW